MPLFQVPPPTKYDLNFNLGNVPVRVHPFFWLLTLAFGASGGGLSSILTWVFAVFVSILVHELGHVFAMQRIGQHGSIVLYHFGGLAYSDGYGWSSYRTRNEQIMISLAGPLAGFALALLVIGVANAAGAVISWGRIFAFIPYPNIYLLSGPGWVNGLISSLIWVNFFWGLINLMPVFPLDGGQVARNLWVQFDPLDGVKYSLQLSVVAGALVAVGTLYYLNSLYMALLFGYLAVQSYQALTGRGLY